MKESENAEEGKGMGKEGKKGSEGIGDDKGKTTNNEGSEMLEKVIVI